MSAPSSRLLHLDALKALAAQAIVWHHLVSYGPIADTVQELLPELTDVLFHHGRMAVQVFLVVGGFLSARALAPRREALQGSLAQMGLLIARRWLRLSLPFFAAVLLTLGCSALVAPWLPDLVPQSVGLAQLVSHALLLHGVLGHESLTVGAWYVAIDLQLFALLLSLLWCAGRFPRLRWMAPVLVFAVVAASLWIFNLDASLDNWAPYFFGAYGLGVLVHWLSESRWRKGWLALLCAMVLAALVHDFRGRIALALVTALALAFLEWRHQGGRPLLPAGRRAALLGHLGTHSYALFLVHFPICLLVNGLFEQKDPTQQGAALMAIISAWLLSNAAAVPFHRWVELPAGRLRWPRWGLQGA
jgi:peptidoglycan/LPS O-acetylase OafA/YrhL